MSLSDCPKCYDTPCTCGAAYESWTPQDIERLRRTLLDVMVQKYVKYLMEAWQGQMGAMDFQTWSKIDE